jgi:hypothetical protein
MGEVIMGGMDMMLKSVLGVDPTELKEQVQTAAKTLQETIARFDTKADLILRNQVMLYNAMVEAGLIQAIASTSEVTTRECHADGIH